MNATEKKVQKLRLAQAEIRELQRDRMDQVHALCHEYWRNGRRKSWGADIPDSVQDEIVEKIHNLTHIFMRSFDDAVIIHERMAELEGRDTSEVAGSLWPVRTTKKEPLDLG